MKPRKDIVIFQWVGAISALFMAVITLPHGGYDLHTLLIVVMLAANVAALICTLIRGQR